MALHRSVERHFCALAKPAERRRLPCRLSARRRRWVLGAGGGAGGRLHTAVAAAAGALEERERAAM